MARKWFTGVLFAGFLLCSLELVWSQNIPEELINYADIVIYNGPVLTMDDQDRTVQAVAVRDGEILAVGTTERILRLAGPPTKRFDLKGRHTLIPGIIDTHIHPNRSATRNFWDDIPPEYQKIAAGTRITKEMYKDKETVIAFVKEIADRTETEWVGLSGGEVDNPVILGLTRDDLDKATTEKPVAIFVGNWYAVLNSKALDILLSTYPPLPGVYTDDQGRPNGKLFGSPFYIVQIELMPQLPDDVLATVFQKQLAAQFPRQGVTTFNSRLNANEIRAFKLIDQKGELPVRLSYSHEIGRWNPMFKRDIKRTLGTPQWYGTDMVWLSGISVAIPDVAPNRGGMLCSSWDKQTILEGDMYPEGMCFWEMEGDPTKETVMTLNRYGYRTSGIHTYGDGGLEIAIDTFMEAAREKPLSAPFGLDHSQMFNPNVIRKAAEIGMIFSIGPGMFSGSRTALTTQVLGKEVVERMMQPVKSLIDAGVLVSWEGEGGESPMWGMETLVTRKTRDGVVVGIREAIDRKTVLRMMTRNGAIYVGREKELGSIEEGKWADLAVLERNPLDPAIPDEDLSEIKTLLTVVAGKVVYDAATAPPDTASGGM